MAPTNIRDTLERARSEAFADEDGNPIRLELRPGLGDEAIEALDASSAVPLTVETRELLRFSSGFELGALATVAFDAEPGSEYGFVSEVGVPIAPDGFGNFWIVDVDRLSGQWGAVLFVCHDPPVVVFQAPSLEVFVEQLLEQARSGCRDGPIDEVCEHAVFRVWEQKAPLTPAGEGRSSTDLAVRAFAEELPDGFGIRDLREASVGDGFAWGRAGPDPDVRRFGSSLLFGVPRSRARRSFLARLFGRRGDSD